MRVQHNIMAMNAYRNYNNNTKKLSGNLEKLSSGYKINRAGDDAAGLAISEKMRAQITGLNAAQKNVKDGISFVKTAEGAMQEIQDMLNRMKYLATQSANGTYDDDVDRANLDKEVTALKSEINRIAESANFNGIYMLNGGGDDTTAAAKSFEAAPADAGGLTNTKITGLTDAIKSVQINTVADSTPGSGDAAGKAEATISKDGKLTITVTGKVDNGAQVTKDAIQAALTKAVTDAKTAGNLTEEQATALKDLKIETTVGAAISASTGTAVNPTEAKAADKPEAGTVSFTKDALNGMITTGTDGLKISGLTDKVKKVAFKTGAAATTTNDPGSAAAAFDKDTGVLTITVTPKNGTGAEVDADGIAAAIKAATGKDDAGDLSKVKVEGTITATTASQATAKEADVATAGDDDDGMYYSITLQIGDDAAGYNQLEVSIGSMRTNAFMGKKFNMTTDPTSGKTTYNDLGGKTISEISIGDSKGAAEAIDTIKNAINYVSSVRGDLGAVQNRLDHTANNLSVMTENIQDAESTIRDTDVAEEMMSYVKNNILVQSAQAMLAQANQVPQGVLQLLG